MDDNLTEITQRLALLRRTADLLCDDALDVVLADRQHDMVMDAVNWGDFGCVSASLIVDEDGEARFHVLLEEADPSCMHVSEWIQGKLAEAGFPNVIVETAW